MSETLVITCGVCGIRTPKAERTRLRWSAEPQRRPPTDCCLECAEKLQAVIGPGRPTKRKAPVTSGAA